MKLKKMIKIKNKLKNLEKNLKNTMLKLWNFQNKLKNLLGEVGGGGSCEETPDEPGVASSGLRALGKGRILSSLLCHFPICQRKFVPDDLQGPAGSESVIFQERGPAQASGALGTSHQLLGEEGV